MKKTVLAFLLILILKISLGFLINGLLVYPDESCFFLKAKTFTQMGEIVSCSDITELSLGNPYPLFSIIISMMRRSHCNRYRKHALNYPLFHHVSYVYRRHSRISFRRYKSQYFRDNINNSAEYATGKGKY